MIEYKYITKGGIAINNNNIEIGTIIVLVFNFTLIYLFSGSIFVFVGIIYTVISILVTVLIKKECYIKFIINLFVRNWNKNLIYNKRSENVIMLSIAFLVGAIKIGTAIGIIIEVSMVLFIALAILIASGFIIEGYSSGMTLSGAYYIAKIIVKAYQFLGIVSDKIMDLIVKIEFSILKIETK